MLPQGGGGDIMTDEEFGAFELQLEFKVSAGANSGIFYLLTSPHDPASNAPLGLEYQILDDERHPDAKLGIDGNRTLASLYDISAARQADDQRGHRAQGRRRGSTRASCRGPMARWNTG